jgi:hypothetical protein
MASLRHSLGPTHPARAHPREAGRVAGTQLRALGTPGRVIQIVQDQACAATRQPGFCG